MPALAGPLEHSLIKEMVQGCVLSCRSLQRCQLGEGWAGTPPQWRRFGLQLAEWTSCVILARLVCGSVVSTASHGPCAQAPDVPSMDSQSWLLLQPAVEPAAAPSGQAEPCLLARNRLPSTLEEGLQILGRPSVFENMQVIVGHHQRT